MFIKQIISCVITGLFLVGCGVDAQKQELQVDTPYQVDIKLRTSVGIDTSTSEEYLNYMKSYNLNALSFNIKKVEGAWNVSYLGNYNGKKAYYFDIDQNNQTGYYNKWVPKVGADYLFEEGVLFKYTGTDGSNEWSWDIISYNGMKDFDHSVDSILAYGVTFNDDWSYRSFLGYYDTETTYKEKNAELVRSEGESNRHESFYISEDDEAFYIRAVNYNYKRKKDTAFYNYEFNVNKISYFTEGNTLFNEAGDIIANDFPYALHDRNSIAVIPKKFLIDGELKLEKAVIKDKDWNTLNSYKYEVSDIEVLDMPKTIPCKDEEYLRLKTNECLPLKNPSWGFIGFRVPDENIYNLTECTQEALVALIEALPIEGGKIIMPECKIEIKNGIDLPSNIILEGAGIGKTIISNTNVDDNKTSAIRVNERNVILRNFTIDGNGVSLNGVDAYSMPNMGNVLVEFIEAKNFKSDQGSGISFLTRYI